MKQPIKSFKQFKELIENDQDLQNAFKNDPVKAIQSMRAEAPIYHTDKWIYRIVVGTLGVVILLVVAGVVILMAENTQDVDEKIPTILTALSSAAIGALTGLLVPSPNAGSGDQ